MKKAKLIMFGVCPKCGREHVRRFPADAMVCTCGNPTVVLLPLYPVLLLPPGKLRWQLEKLAELADVPLEKLVNAMLLEDAKEKLQEMKPLPQLKIIVNET